MASAGAHCDPEPATAGGAAPDRRIAARVVLLGNPNTGKTTVFNRLCGTRAKTSNFPGTTTSVRTGRAIVGTDTAADILDLPGLYQLNLDVPEAELAKRRAALEAAGGYKYPASQTPWQEIQRGIVDELSQGMVLKPAVKYQRINTTFGLPRDNH